jgi:hypothetical protein
MVIINKNHLKVEQRLYKIRMNNQMIDLSQARKLILENNLHIAFSSMNELLKIL